MTLTCEPFESHESPGVLLAFDWTFGESLLLLRPQIESTAAAFAARLTADHPLLAVPASVVFTEWGPVADPGVPADTIRVYVGPASGDGVLGSSAPASSFDPLPRYGAASLGINPAADFGRYSLPAAVEHEVTHAVGVLPHSDDPDALMAEDMPPGVRKQAGPSDVALARRYGWDIGPPESLLHGAVVENPWGQIGWARLSPEMAAGWWRAGTLR